MSTGKKEARHAAAERDYWKGQAQTAAAEAKVKGPVEEAREKEYLAHQQWKLGKDYRTPAPGMISLGYGDVAQRQRMRERAFNMADTGLSALGGGGNATAQRMAKLNMADEFDEFDRDSSQTYEGAVKAEDDYQRTGNSESLMARDFARKMGIASLYSQNYNNAAQVWAQLRPQSLWPALISGGLSGLSGALQRQGAPGARQGRRRGRRRREAAGPAPPVTTEPRRFPR